METTKFVRKPFIVEAIQITEDNMEQLAEKIGTINTKPDGTRYIQVDRKLVPSIFRVYPGFWMTTIGKNIRCYAPHIFEEQFVKADESVVGWVDYINGAGEEVGASNE